jgi:hypothetical protein
MGAPHKVQVGNLIYTVVDDCTTTYWAILTGSVSDEILGALSAPDFTVDAGRPDLSSKTTATGLFAIVGRPDVSFPHHSTTTYPLTLAFRASGFRDIQLSLPSAVPAGASFPVPVPPVLLRRLPVRMQGRIVNDVTRAPVPGALVTSIDDPSSPPPLVHVTALRTPLYFDHPSGAPVQPVTLTPTGGANLAPSAGSGSRVIELSTRLGLAPGGLIRLSDAANLGVEYGGVDHLGPGAPGAGQVFLRNALNRSHPASPLTTVQFLSPAPTGAPVGLAAEANSGDGVLLAGQLFTSGVLAFEFGTPQAEYHEIGALSDSDGYYALDGMGRAAQIFFKATQGALKQTIGWFLEYDREVNLVDFRLS